MYKSNVTDKSEPHDHSKLYFLFDSFNLSGAKGTLVIPESDT